MTCGGGRNGAFEELDQVQHSISESLRSFGGWIGSVPVGFVLDNVSGFTRNAVGFELRIVDPGFFPLWWEVPANPGVFQVSLGLNFGTNKWKRNNLAPPLWLHSPEPLLPHPGRALWCPSSCLDLYRIPSIPWWSSPLSAVGYSHGKSIFVFDADGKRGIFLSS